MSLLVKKPRPRVGVDKHLEQSNNKQKKLGRLEQNYACNRLRDEAESLSPKQPDKKIETND